MNKKAFTLIELIVVVTILAILGTVGFVSFQGYTKDARDSVRLNNLANLSKAMEVTILSGKDLPMPGGKVDISAGGSVFSYQGYASKDVLGYINIVGENKDPLDDSYFTYVVNSSLNKYQILGFLEEGNEVSAINRAYANLQDRKIVSKGHTLGVLLDQNNVPVQEKGNNIDISTTTDSFKLHIKESSPEISGDNNQIFPAMHSSNEDLFKNKQMASLNKNLVGYWDMETTIVDGGVTKLKDLSASGYHGTCIVNLTSQVNCGEGEGQEISGGKMQFSGDDYVKILGDDIYSNEMTVIAYIKPTVLDDAYHGFFGYQQPGSGKRPFNLWITRNRYASKGGLHYRSASSSSTHMTNGQTSGNVGSPFDPNSSDEDRMFIAYKREEGKLRIKYNGKYILNRTITYTDFFRPDELWLGRVDNYFIGNIYEIRVYNKALSDEEIDNIHKFLSKK